MEINTELKEVIDTLQNKNTICLLAPSFVVDFKYPDTILNLRKIGFNKVVELTYAAKLINMKIHDIISKNKDNNKQFICANCPSVVKYIEAKYPQHKDKIMDIASPMVAMGRYMKNEFSNYKTVFIGPCVTKKQEAKENEAVDYAITFKELQEIFNYFKESNLELDIPKTEENLEFDKLYNDYTKIYPLSGGVAKTLHLNGLLTEGQVIIADKPDGIDNSIKKMEENNKIKFLDILFCDGGCIGGPGIISTDSIEDRKQRVINYREESKKHKIGKEHFGKFKYSEGLDLSRKK